MSAVRTLRAARSAPNLRRSIKTSTPTPNPSSLLSQSQYTSLSVQALKQECRKKGLKVGGKKSELIDRLSSHDASRLTNSGIADVKFVSTKQAGKSNKIPKSMPSTPIKQTKRKQTTTATAPSTPTWSVDRIKLPAGWQMQETKKVPFKIPVPPDANNSKPKLAHTEYTIPKPDDGATAVPGGSSSGTTEKVHILGNDNARSLEDGATIDRLSGNVKGEYYGRQYRHEEFQSKDKRFLAGFAATVAGWWALGSIGKKKDDTK